MPQTRSSSLPFKAVVFDAYGTLFDVYSVTHLAERLYPGKGEALALLWRQKQLEYSWLRAMSGRYKSFWDVTRDALRFACAKLQLVSGADHETQLMGQYARLEPFAENLQVLASLKADGLSLAILTNGNREMIEASVRNAGMQGLFDHLLTSDAVQTFKTTHRIYEQAPEALGCAASECLFVSSNGWDAIAAKWFGFTSFWINRAHAPLEQLDTQPDHVGFVLTDVLHLTRTAIHPTAQPTASR